MAEHACTLGYGVTYDMVATHTACGQPLTLTSHRGRDAIPPHQHVNDYLCLVLRGGFAEQEGSRCQERQGGCFFTHQAGETHHDRFGPDGAMCLNLHFAPGESWPPVSGMCSASTSVSAAKLAFDLAAGSHEELVMASLAAEIMGDVRPVGRRTHDRGNWLGRIVEAISDEPHRRWTLRELAAIADRHPVHVAQAFRAKTGISLGAFQRIGRLTRLSLALRHENHPLAILATEFGYCDQAHMNLEFRSAFGVSPGRFRREFH
jgi:AraC family transcriptional regulator